MPGKILVIEDDEMSRILLCQVLHYHGYVPIEAEDGEAGIEKAKEHRPDLIFMDIQMRGMDGFTVLKALLNDPDIKNIKVIATTALAMKYDRERILEAGFDDYIAKPIETKQIPAIIAKHLGEPA